MSDTWQNAPAAPAAPAPSQAGGWDSAPEAPSNTRQTAVSAAANDNPDEAAKAIKLGRQSNLPASVVQSDLPGYEANAKQKSAVQATQNPALAKYIDGNASAAKVSADDWNKLDEVSQTLYALHPELIRSQAQGGVFAAVPEIAELMKTDAGMQKLTNSLIALPYHLGKGLYDFGASLVTLPGKSYQEGFGSPAQVDEAIGLGLGIALGSGGARGPVKVGRPAPDAGGAPAGLSSFDDFMHTLDGMKTRKEIDDFIASKQDAPPGAVLQIEHAKAGSVALDRAVETAQGSKTKERSPELFAEAAEAHDPGNVHIPASTILDLYKNEGKTPAPGDGLFGDMPGVAAKLQAAGVTGSEVTIPVAQYIAHVDPTVHEGIKDSIRLHDDGVTLAEAEEAKAAIEAWHGTPHDFERFDLSKIGTGEGAQVYGHGLYFAENRAVGEQYRDQLSPQISPLARDFIAKGNGDTAVALAEFNKSAFKGDEALRKEIETGQAEKAGQLYKVHINADPTKFLDWDKPLSEQDPIILQKLAEASVKVLGGDVESQLRLLKESSQQGGEFYLNLAEELKTGKKTEPDKNGVYRFDNGHEATSKAFAEAGIPGIKYLDQGSRPLSRTDNLKNALRALENDKKMLSQMIEAGASPEEIKMMEDQILDRHAAVAKHKEPTRNFVVFDDKLVTIKEKNGNPVEALLEAAVESTKQLLGLRPQVFMDIMFKDAKALGITDTEFKAYSDKVARAEQLVLDKAVAVNKREIARALTPEWKRNEAAIRDEVSREMQSQGPFAVEKYLRENKITLGGDDIDAIADGLAPIWGFESGDALRQGLINIETEKAASGKGPLIQLREAIAAETARRMEEQHGNLAENIAKEAREIALADHTFDVLAQEVRILANAAGTTPPLSRGDLVDWARSSFERRNIADAANWLAHQRAVARGGREAEKALLKGDFPEAFKAKQEQFLAAVWAKQALEFQGVVDKAEGKIDRFTTEQTIAGISQDHLDQIRSMLGSVGVPQQFPPGLNQAPLRDFVAQAEGQLAVAPDLMDGKSPKIEAMTVEQFRDFVKSMQSLEHGGRSAMKLENAMGQAELQNVVFDVVKELERFPFIDQPNNPSIKQRVASVARKIVGAHLLVERALDYTDKFNPHGPLSEWLDRPLRDANSKEIALTEEVVRDLKTLRQHVDKSILDPIENKLIPDALDKTGFLKMDRQNLRVLMLNMGNRSNMGKLSEGFGVDEKDLRRFVDTHATAKDVAWVNGVHAIFKKLKPEADAVQFKDTGVPVDTIEPAPSEVRAGKLEGGYYPLSYDPYNSDIQGHIARPLFDKGYFSAATPQGYTKERTGYNGAIDLTGDFLSSKIQGMVHDIAFRLAVRNANKLIENQEFRTAMAQYWGKEVADLLPGWLRDIANSHNLDDNYAKGMQRGAALIRQNVTQTLIAYNPSTFIKHGFTAAVMSADRVGLGNLFSAAADIGAKGALKAISDLLPGKKGLAPPDQDFIDSFRDLMDQGQRGENARQFILDSSAVMRARLRQYEDSIRGATDAITNIGPAQTFAEFRQRQMQYGRLAVAFSDQMSAMPTWMAAYKKAYQAGESHADAVFIADKEVSRAHGSGFVGDKPLVSRVANTPTGEFARWFTSLYNFWNHQQNNQFQLAWDVAAATGKDRAPEPGANAWSISRRVGLILGIIAIEELAGPAKDESGHGVLTQMALASIRYMGGGFVGLREVTNGLAHGYEPTTGMIGTLFKAGTETAKDIGSATGLRAKATKDVIRNTMTAVGFLTGVGGSQLGRTAQFGADVATGKDRPRTFNDYRQGLRTGHSKARKH